MAESIKELVKRWYPSIDQGRIVKTGTHRALDDIQASIEELRYYRKHVFVDGTTPDPAPAPSGNGVSATIDPSEVADGK